MKEYSHDYTKVAEAENLLYSATRLIANECWDAALDRINETRKLLQQYLSQDNMVEDDDVADGWVKASDTFDDEQLDFIRDLFAIQLEMTTKSDLNAEELAIINVCQRNLGCPEFESVEQFLRNKSDKWSEIVIEEEK